MIKCLIIGTQNSVDSYSKQLEGIRFFSLIEKHIIEGNNPILPFINFNKYDALLFAQNPPQIRPFIESAMRQQCNIYFTDQNWMDTAICAEWLKINSEANNLFFTEIPEILHPITIDFLESHHRHSTIHYCKNVDSNKQFRETLLNALGIISLVNPMQIKKVDINSMETTPRGKPVIKIRLKMHDHSFGYIKLKQEKKEEHILKIKNNKGTFIFNYRDGYLQNTHGTRFDSDTLNTQQLRMKNIESFGIHIIQNQKPTFSLFHYQSVLKIMGAIENILIQNF
ncbi:MAG: hypothetical protein K9G70_01245 [Prolixibacteraceae bacterium]|nr:hypothetical protein [Prolixibacteraceae bacterium]